MAYNIGIVGANGLIGHDIIDILGDGESGIDVQTLYALTSKKQSGYELSFGDRDITTIDKDGFDYSKTDIVIYAPTTPPSKSEILNIADSGAKIIDCSGVMMFEGGKDNIICLPSARASLLLDALKPIAKYTKITDVTLTTMEATSGEGKDGMDELFNQSRKFFVTDGLEPAVFGKQIAFNLIPQVGDFMDSGQTQSEWLLSAEMKKFMHKDIKVTATCVQAPVFVGHSMAVNVECEGDITVETAIDLWRSSPDTIVIDRMSEMEYVTPAEIPGEEAVYISRIRDHGNIDNGLSFWCVGDNIRAGVAVKVIETLKAISAP